MDMNIIEADVDAARAAATRVREAREKAAALKDDTMQITGQDDWELHKKAKSFCEDAEQIMLEAQTAYGEASNRRHAVEDATRVYVQVNKLAKFAQRTARFAYDQANKDMNDVLELVSEVKQNCKDACERLR